MSRGRTRPLPSAAEPAVLKRPPEGLCRRTGTKKKKPRPGNITSKALSLYYHESMEGGKTARRLTPLPVCVFQSPPDIRLGIRRAFLLRARSSRVSASDARSIGAKERLTAAFDRGNFLFLRVSA